MAADARLRKLYEAASEHHSKTGEILVELGKALNGEKGIGHILKELQRDLSAIWAVRYHADYVWNFKLDTPPMKRLIKTLKPDDIRARWQTYLNSGDPYYAQARHGFSLFASQVNRFAGLTPAGELDLSVDTPADCKHTPRCKTDQEHTRKRSADLRS
jgi:hypothetical protein